MKTFDLVKFRSRIGLNQEDFAKRVNKSQALISRIEGGTIPVSNKFLDAVADAFGINLDDFKKYNQRTIAAEEMRNSISDEIGMNHLSSKHAMSEFGLRYAQLLEEKNKISERFSRHAGDSLEVSLLKENYILLQTIVEQNEKVLALLGELEQR